MNRMDKNTPQRRFSLQWKSPKPSDMRNFSATLVAILLLCAGFLSTAMAQTGCDNVTDGGAIAGNESGCPDPVFDPAPITNVSLPTGGTGSIEYMWMYTTGDPNTPVNTWYTIPNSNSPDFDPGPITETTHYQRCSRRSGCVDWIGETNYVTKLVDCCDNVTDGGTIGEDQIICDDSVDPDSIFNISLPSGGSGNLMFQWYQSNTGTPFDFSNTDWTQVPGAGSDGYDPGVINQNTYFVRVAKREDCADFIGVSNMVSILLVDSPVLDTFFTTNPTCFGGEDGSAAVVVSGGTPPYTYAWDNNTTDSVVTGLSAGTYSVTILDDNFCGLVTEVTIDNPDEIFTATSWWADPCDYVAGGNATVSVDMGQPPYSFVWSDANGTMDDTLSGVGRGAYFVTITDMNGCTKVDSVFIDIPEAFNFSFDVQNTSCDAASNGVAVVTVTGGNGNTAFQWNDSGNTTSDTLRNVSAGTYTVTATDEDGCAAVDSVVIGADDTFLLTFNSENASCDVAPNGMAVVEVVNANGPYSYQWNDANNTTNDTLPNVPSGTYTVTVTDGYGCTAVDSVEVQADDIFALIFSTTNATCDVAENGAAVVAATGGTGPYSYTWNDLNSTTGDTLTGVVAGTYGVTVTDAFGCAAVDSVSVAADDVFDLTFASSGTSCSLAANGSAIVTPSGGSGPYSYSWNDLNGTTSDTLMGVTAGIYTVTVTDVFGCAAIDSIEITVDDIFELQFNARGASCSLANDGSARVAVVNGTPPFTYQWNDINNTTSDTVVNLAAGIYAVTVSDQWGCMAVDSVEIVNLPPFALQFEIRNAACVAASNGQIIVDALGKTGITFTWDDPNNTVNDTLQNLAAGTYNVTATDVFGCESTGSATVLADTIFSIGFDVTNASCSSLEDGQVVVTANGGQNLSYSWNDPAGTNSDTLRNVGAGTYSVVVSDPFGCSVTDSVVVGADTPFTFDFSVENATCPSAMDGRAVVTINGGIAQSYLWSDTNGTTSDTLVNVLPGTYSVTVSDVNGCVEVDSVTIGVDNQYGISYQITEPLCFGDANGAATIQISTGNTGFSFSWNDPANTAGETIINVAAGTYMVTIDDGNGCIYTDSVTINQPGELEANAFPIGSGCDLVNGSVASSPTGGTAPFSFSWNDPFAQQTDTATNLANGDYIVTVMDANGCTDTDTTTLDNITTLSLEMGSVNNTCLDDQQGVAWVTPSGGIAPYTLEWSNGGFSDTISNLANGTYTVTITDAGGCDVTGSLIINATNAVEVEVQGTNPTCAVADNGTALAVVNAATPVSYLWNTSDTSASISDLAPGMYMVTVTDTAGCAASDTITLVAGPGLSCVVSITSDYNGVAISQRGASDGEVTVLASGGSGNYSYNWSNGASGPVNGGLSAGTYFYTVTDDQGCECTGSIRIMDPAMVTGLAWNDLNENGLQDFGEPNFANVSVNLQGTNDLGQTIDLNTTTRTNGIYEFDGLRGGTYTVAFGAPGGFEFTLMDVGNNDNIDSDPDPDTGVTNPFLLNSSSVNFQDAGFKEVFINLTLDIGDFVWFDTDKDGIQDMFEAGVPNVTVNLFDATNDQFLASEITDTNGEYLFVDVDPGTYYIIFERNTFPSGYVFTTARAGNDPALDSNPDSLTGRTPNFVIVADQDDELSIDAGIAEDCANITNGGTISGDEQLCGQGADPSPILDAGLPSGGTGNIEYIWMFANTPTYNGLGDPNWYPIPNSNSPSYDPGPINQSTYYLRCSRREGCTDYIGETNIVAKIIRDLPTALILVGQTSVCNNTNVLFDAANAGVGATYTWNFDGGTPPVSTSRTAGNVRWSSGGQKTVSLIVSRQGCTAADTMQMTVLNCLNNIVNASAERIRDSYVEVDWETEGEDLGTVFMVEKSMDGINFEIIETIAGKNSPSNRNSYRYLDYDIENENIWYRIKHMDASGDYVYSDLLMVEKVEAADKKPLVYPNPAQDHINIHWTNTAEGSLDIEVFNALGKSKHILRIDLKEAGAGVSLPVLPSGIYFLRITDESGWEEIVPLSIAK